MWCGEEKIFAHHFDTLERRSHEQVLFLQSAESDPTYFGFSPLRIGIQEGK
jgi:hypothetical protein